MGLYKYVVCVYIGGCMFRIVICEDDLSQRELLKGFLYKVFEEIQEDLDLIEFESGEEALLEEVILKGIDIFFLDIQMNKLTGMDLARWIRKENDTSEIIFVTSLVNYIQEGYTVRAYRYLLKPINYEDLRSHLLSCISDITKKRENFMRMIEDGKNKYFDLIVTKEVSRFSRDTIDSLLYTRKLLEYDVCVYFTSDNIITASNDGELRLTIMSSMAQDEVRKLSERTKFGFKRSIETNHLPNWWIYRF